MLSSRRDDESLALRSLAPVDDDSTKDLRQVGIYCENILSVTIYHLVALPYLIQGEEEVTPRLHRQAERPV